MNAAFAATGEFNDMLQREGFFVFANGLEPVGSATTVDGQGDPPVFTDGPYAQSAAHLGGFWIVEVPDRDTALRLAAERSKACRGVVEMRPFAALPDQE